MVLQALLASAVLALFASAVVHPSLALLAEGRLICGVSNGAAGPSSVEGGAALYGASPITITSDTSAVSGAITFC